MPETEKGGAREGGEEREETRNEERIMHGEGEADHLHRNKGRGAATPIQQASEPLPVTTRVDGSEGLEGPGEQEKTTQGASHSGGAAGTPPDVDPRLPSQYTTTGRTRPNTATVLRGVTGQRPPPPPVLPPVQEHEPVVQRFPTPPPQAASHMVPVHLAPYDQHHIQAPGAIHPGGGPPGYPFPHFPQMNQGFLWVKNSQVPFTTSAEGKPTGDPTTRTSFPTLFTSIKWTPLNWRHLPSSKLRPGDTVRTTS